MKAAILSFPLSPSLVMAMFHEDMPVNASPDYSLNPGESLRINKATLGGSYTYGFERPSDDEVLARLRSFTPLPPMPAFPFLDHHVLQSRWDQTPIFGALAPRRWMIR